MDRHLAAVLYADIVGYSRLMEIEEVGTLAALRQLRDEVVDPIIAKHRGQTVKLMGDGALVEFSSAVNAVTCAAEIQQAMSVAQKGVPDDRQIRFRIGINLGDIVYQDNDIYGDGVNVAARLQERAEAGGICISGAVFDAVRHKTALGFTDLGRVRVKNISEPLSVFRVETDKTLGGQVRRLGLGWKNKRLIVAAATTATLLVAVIAIYTWPGDMEQQTIELAKSVPIGPSIAVLPFDDHSGDANPYFAKGLHEDLITELSGNRNLFVIARNSVVEYVQSLGGTAVDVGEAGPVLGARYLVEGSVERSSDRFRVSVQLIEAETERHLWANRFDREATSENLFAIRDELVQEITSAILPQIKVDEEKQALARPPRNLTAYDLTVQGRYYKHQLTTDGIVKAKRVLQQAIDIDPDYAEAHAYLGYTIYVDHALLLTEDARSPTALEESKNHLETAIRLKPDIAVAYQAMAQILSEEGRTAEAVTHASRAVEFGPNDAENWIFLSFTLLSAGRIDEALAAGERAMRHNPFAPVYYLAVHGRALYFAGQFEESRKQFSLCLIRFSKYLSCRAYLAAALIQLDQHEAAVGEIEMLLAQKPDASVDWLASGTAIVAPGMKAQLAEDLRQAGLPIETPKD